MSASDAIRAREEAKRPKPAKKPKPAEPVKIRVPDLSASATYSEREPAEADVE